MTTALTPPNLQYDTLMDEEKRATYNMLSGFATDHSVNPFEDTSGQFARDQAFVVRMGWGE